MRDRGGWVSDGSPEERAGGASPGEATAVVRGGAGAPLDLRDPSTAAGTGGATRPSDAFAAVVDPALLDGLLERVDDVLLVIDGEDRVAYIGEGVEDLLGWRRDQVVDRPVRDFVDEATAESTLDVIGYRGGPATASTRVRVRAADGATRDVLVLAGVLRGVGERGWWSLVLRPVAGAGAHLDALRQRLAFEDLQTRVASTFVQLAAGEIDDGVGRALAEIGRWAGADRAYVLLVDDRRRVLEAAHEWTADGVDPRPEHWRRPHQAALPGWLGALRSLEPIYLPRVADLDPEWRGERDFLTDAGTRSMLAVPMADQGRLVGCIGVDSVTQERTWADDHLSVLASAAGIIAQALARRDAEQRLTTAFDRAPLGMAVLGVDGRHLEVNDAYLELVDRPASEVLGHTLLELVARQDRAELLTRHRALVEGRVERDDAEVRVAGQGDRHAWLRLHVSAVRDDDRSVRYLLVHAEDITLRHLQELELRASEERYRTLVENSPAIVSRFDRDLRLVYLSPAFDALGHDGEAAVGRTLELLGDPERVPQWLSTIRHVLTTGERVDSEWELDVGGDRRCFQSRAVPELDDDGRVAHVLVMNTDITALKRSEAELAHRALHDPLTGLANRSLLEDALGAVLRTGPAPGSVAVLFLDLDRFKLVNDSLGHTAGDELLGEVARRLTRVVPEQATVARLGGDEFVVLLAEVEGLAQTLDVAEAVHRVLDAPLAVAGTEVTTTTSIGIAVLADHHDAVDGLLRDADAAMYLAKARGRHRTEVCDDALRDAAGRRLEMERHLRRSLDVGRFEVHYQPEVAIGSDGRDRVVGVEALARWDHPERGLLEAGDFIELAEETGLIVELGRWVLGEACRQAGRWLDDRPGAELTVRVNLSPRQLAQPELVDGVVEALARSGLPPAALCLEITETALMDDPVHGARVLTELHDLGVRLAVDDFGTGYSSLAQLKRFPVDVLKIDRSFVVGLGVEAEETAIVEAIISMARALGLEVVAEGVERPEQLDELRRLGCHRAQGWLWARAEPPGQVVRHLPG